MADISPSVIRTGVTDLGGNLIARREDVVAREKRGVQLPSGRPAGQLSMGMSGDFAIAIEEGATIVRIGSRLFEGLQP